MWHLGPVALRRGELCGLRWTDIDFDARTISIEITRDDGERCSEREGVTQRFDPGRAGWPGYWTF